MSITKLPDGLWFVDVEPIKDKRFRKRFKTKGEAQRFEATVRQKCTENLAWSIKPKALRAGASLVRPARPFTARRASTTLQAAAIGCPIG